MSENTPFSHNSNLPGVTRKRSHKLHIMLNNHHRTSPPKMIKKLRQLHGLIIGHPSRRLIKQEKRRLLHKQHPNLEPLLLPMRKLTGESSSLTLQPDQRERLFNPRLCLAIEPRPQ